MEAHTCSSCVLEVVDKLLAHAHMRACGVRVSSFLDFEDEGSSKLHMLPHTQKPVTGKPITGDTLGEAGGWVLQKACNMSL